jgi:hypothetical protein
LWPPHFARQNLWGIKAVFATHLQITNMKFTIVRVNEKVHKVVNHEEWKGNDCGRIQIAERNQFSASKQSSMMWRVCSLVADAAPTRKYNTKPKGKFI